MQQLSYQWDTLGNLRSRTDKTISPHRTETFGYDELNRLKDATIGSEVKSYQYDDFGNLTHKDNNAYLYEETGNAGPHAVTNVAGISYSYDLNGNQTSGDGRTLEYATFGKPTKITKGNAELRFDYGPGRNRYKKRIFKSNHLTETKITAGGVEVLYKTEGNTETTEIRAYITDSLLKLTYTNGSVIPTKKTQYLFKDHLGSTDTVVTPNGSSDTVVKMSFGSFGERRNLNWDAHLTLTEILDLDLAAITDKGYTGHEQLDDVGLIHMNGRVYDAKLGRFMSADPHIQAPTDTQSLNRYSYVLNNPLSATDPSGYFSLRKWVGTIVAIVGTALCPGVCTHAAYIWIGAASGAASAAANGGNILKGALIGAFTGEMFYQIGQYAQRLGEAGGGTWQVGCSRPNYHRTFYQIIHHTIWHFYEGFTTLRS